jgi:hypothetical protein
MKKMWGIEDTNDSNWFNGWKTPWSETPVYRYKTFLGCLTALQILKDRWIGMSTGFEIRDNGGDE